MIYSSHILICFDIEYTPRNSHMIRTLWFDTNIFTHILSDYFIVLGQSYDYPAAS